MGSAIIHQHNNNQELPFKCSVCCKVNLGGSYDKNKGRTANKSSNSRTVNKSSNSRFGSNKKTVNHYNQAKRDQNQCSDQNKQITNI